MAKKTNHRLIEHVVRPHVGKSGEAPVDQHHYVFEKASCRCRFPYVSLTELTDRQAVDVIKAYNCCRRLAPEPEMPDDEEE